MKSIRTDLIVLSILVSLAAHFGIMYYAKPLIMTHVVKAGHSSRAPRHRAVKMADIKETPPPVDIREVKDVEPDKDAPDADESTIAAPKLEAQLPINEGDLAAPEVEMPQVSMADLPVEALPEVMSASVSPEVGPPLKMVTDAGVPTEPGSLSHLPELTPSDIAAAPIFGIPEISLGAVPTESAEEKAMGDLARHKREATPEFVPPPEVMDNVSESMVAAEKDAVKDLVDSLDAANLADYVEVTMTQAASLDGRYFRVKVTPKAELKTVPKDVVVLIDASGSIGRDRMVSIRTAAKKILRSAANTGDRFNVVAFRDRFSYMSKSWLECDVKTFDAADKWLNNVAPFGRTDVFKTIRSVLTLPRDPTRPLIALVVTDGDANAGVSDTAQILSKFSKLNDGLVSVYMYGVKNSANRELIEVLTQGNRGESFIFEETGWGSSNRAGEHIPELSNRFRDPVLTDLRLVFASSCENAEAYPRLLKNLYAGESVEFIGKLPPDAREVAFSLKGLNGKDAYEAYFSLPLDEAKFEYNLDKAWAKAHAVDLKLR